MTGIVIFALLTVCGVISLLSRENRKDGKYVIKVVGYVFILILVATLMVIGKAVLGV